MDIQLVVVDENTLGYINPISPTYKRNGYDYYPLRPFQARDKRNRKLKTSYSVK